MAPVPPGPLNQAGAEDAIAARDVALAECAAGKAAAVDWYGRRDDGLANTAGK